MEEKGEYTIPQGGRKKITSKNYQTCEKEEHKSQDEREEVL